MGLIRGLRHGGGGPGDSWRDGGGEDVARAPDEELRDDGLQTHVLRMRPALLEEIQTRPLLLPPATPQQCIRY